ncbi:hypothetical protein B9Z19DRAFT_572551 [Tuber borchii]|uniref:Uncharacterized protein n=1 Tax=Tuber borchii TaxID=42251 RepID=A0A2T7A1U2_TUBBO|nr:hypothetical protein B9Z19DRAFT_572551 [Tuber borchii]
MFEFGLTTITLFSLLSLLFLILSASLIIKLIHPSIRYLSIDQSSAQVAPRTLRLRYYRPCHTKPNRRRGEKKRNYENHKDYTPLLMDGDDDADRLPRLPPDGTESPNYRMMPQEAMQDKDF